jgi:hypothetical protein
LPRAQGLHAGEGQNRAPTGHCLVRRSTAPLATSGQWGRRGRYHSPRNLKIKFVFRLCE